MSKVTAVKTCTQLEKLGYSCKSVCTVVLASYYHLTIFRSHRSQIKIRSDRLWAARRSDKRFATRKITLKEKQNVSSSQDQHCASRFWSKVGEKNENYLFYPSAKSRRELNIKSSGVIFRGASVHYGQKSIASPKWAVRRIFGGNFSPNSACTKGVLDCFAIN